MKYEGRYTNITQITEALETSNVGNSVTRYLRSHSQRYPGHKKRYDRHRIRNHLVAYYQALGYLCQTAPSCVQDEAAQAPTDFDLWYTQLKSQNQAFQNLMINARDGKTSLTRFRTVLIEEGGKEASVYTTGSDNAVTKALKAAHRKAHLTQVYQENEDNTAFIIKDIIARRRHNRA